ncbi:hypothetical protein KHC23_22565 [Ancylobacter dichloromethanicus]|uniref:Uncharacterized protein n=1 Tax=Ancylobacter dichloromethanicus TaxID=518825 RepID=A0A9W6JDG6_9HYPH|nr:hypothetical protein [Ancylobacter dichloromethanicus]MBS7556419.1 hypothetical protein [Ancylobacter dichloromethanicus]GLK73714.1 hypothetical protein GCM10017643_38320 [Ancylobacter dichloromethanicus]
MRRFFQKWDFFSAALLAIVGAYFVPHNAMKDITTELIAFFSIQSAVILPAMIFTAGILKPDGLELEDAARYHKALKAQMLFWVALLSLDFVAVVALIAGKALNWILVLPMPAHFEPLDLGWLLPAILYFSGSLAVFRTIPFVRGVLSLLDVNSDMTLRAITRRNKIENADRKAQADPRPMTLPEGYGKVVKPQDE